MPCGPTEFFSLQGSVAAADFSVFPNLKLIATANASQDWQVPYELTGITLSTSLTNFSSSLMGVFVIIGANTSLLSYGKSTSSPLHAITGQNSLVGPPAVFIPSDKSQSKVYLNPPVIKPGTKIALYAFGDTTAGNSLTAFVSLDMQRKL